MSALGDTSEVKRARAFVTGGAAASSIVAGRVNRSKTIDEWNLATKQPLRDLLRGRRIPDRATCAALCVWGEAVSNVYLHAKADSMRYSLRIEEQIGEIKMTAAYKTARFNTAPPTPPLYAEHGRGLILMRELSNETIWRWNGGELTLILKIEWEIL